MRAEHPERHACSQRPAGLSTKVKKAVRKTAAAGLHGSASLGIRTTPRALQHVLLEDHCADLRHVHLVTWHRSVKVLTLQ